MHHDLKLLKRFFEAKAAGLKPWEVRVQDDRHFAVGDTVTFHEVDAFHLEPTGREYGPESIVYVLEGVDGRGLIPHGSCVFTHKPDPWIQRVQQVRQEDMARAMIGREAFLRDYEGRW